VLILGGYLGGKYAQQAPLSLSSTICFEQSYDGVDGDSASSTELYAILSSLAEIPIKQGIAVTGSVNQNGEVQAIGGVNYKIEGHFDICRLKGFAPGQGVMIPRANVRNLMLRADVVDAIKAGKFRIYAVGTVDEGIEVLTGVSAGARNGDGSYPEGSVNDRVQKKLQSFTEQQKKLAAPDNQRNG
jgi:predicted ATP-dependent protease